MVIGQYPKYLYQIGLFLWNKKRSKREKSGCIICVIRCVDLVHEVIVEKVSKQGDVVKGVVEQCLENYVNLTEYFKF